MWQEWELDPDGRLFRLREIYKTQTLVEDQYRTIKALLDVKTPTAQICDHDAVKPQAAAPLPGNGGHLRVLADTYHVARDCINLLKRRSANIPIQVTARAGTTEEPLFFRLRLKYFSSGSRFRNLASSKGT